ncbi:MAG: DUF1385 domain-containing protein [Oscillospiraceae bacterium]|jgi:uncharacterized protein YqhQ|nr:DUF1385 domain-containing protein [Oscillospiraceae bacterium]
MGTDKEKTVKKTSIGGQALIEGVLMKGPTKTAIAIRTQEGEIQIEDFGGAPLKEKYKILGVPFIRGVAGFIESMAQGYKALMRSAELSGMDLAEGEEELSGFEKWLFKVCGDKLFNIIMAIAMVLGLALSFFLFFWLPTIAFRGIDYLCGGALTQSGLTVYQSIFEGVLKMIIFTVYLWFCSRLKDIRRVFEYHGAEHKSIFCYEKGLELTVENVKAQSRFHPRCGTSFMILMLVIGIIVGMFVPSMKGIAFGTILRALSKIALLPVVMALGYELLKLSGRHDNIFTRIIAAPGMWMQRLTTNEPDESQIECAIASLNAVIPENKEADNW